jgi:hypothetical protein
MQTVTSHYDALFAEIADQFGQLSPKVMSAIVGFSAGGPVSVARVDGKPLYVTCELSLYPEQIPSSEGERFEFLVESPLDPSAVQDLLSSLGRLSFHEELGDGHTIDLSNVSPTGGPQLVSLRHFSSVALATGRFGIYQVLPA